VKRREFITLVGGAVAWPLVARAQGERVRRIGVLMGLAEDDPEMKARLAATLPWPRRTGPSLQSIHRTQLLGPVAQQPPGRLTPNIAPALI
jgi:hypothetical protein